MIFLFKVSFIPILEMWTWMCKPGSVLIICPWLSSLAQTWGFSFWPQCSRDPTFHLCAPYALSVSHMGVRYTGMLVPNTALVLDTACPGQLLSPARPQHTLPQHPERRFSSDLSSGKAGIPWGKCFCLCVIVFSLRNPGSLITELSSMLRLLKAESQLGAPPLASGQSTLGYSLWVMTLYLKSSYSSYSYFSFSPFL